MIKEINFKYCPNCGKNFKPPVGNLLLCPSCGVHFYINPKATTSVILENKNGEILFVVRKFDPQKGMLDFPGGFVDMDESLEQCSVREIQEELGIVIDVEDLTYLGSLPDDYNHGLILSRTINAYFKANISDNIKIVPNDDVAGFEFIKPEAVDYGKMAFSGMKIFLKKYLEKRA